MRAFAAAMAAGVLVAMLLLMPLVLLPLLLMLLLLLLLELPGAAFVELERTVEFAPDDRSLKGLAEEAKDIADESRDRKKR